MNTGIKTTDIVVIGGGIIGAAVAYGLTKTGSSVVMLDEGDTAFRAARANFGLVWFQGKGLGSRRYVEWCLEATDKWPEFAAELFGINGMALFYENTGGLRLCYTWEDFQKRKALIDGLKDQNGKRPYDCEMLEHQLVQDMLPGVRLGESIVGASYSPRDGHLNPLCLLTSLHDCFQHKGGRYFPAHAVRKIRQVNDVFIIETGAARFGASKVVLAAGTGTVHLASMLGMRIPIQPQRGQILVTERVRPTLSVALETIRQTNEGSFLLGASHEEVGFDVHTSTAVVQKIARRAIRAFPDLAALKLVRCWGALRVLSPDEMPIYLESEEFPGVYVVTSHSGVSLAPLHACHIPGWIVECRVPQGFADFDLRRFHVQKNQ